MVLTPKAMPDSDFVGWTGACAGTGPCNIHLDKNTTVRAEFRIKPISLSITVEGTGSVLSDDDRINCVDQCQDDQYKFGDQVTLTASAGPSMVFKRWSTPSCGTTPKCTVRLIEEHTVRAQFVPPAVLTWSSTIAGGIESSVHGVAMDHTGGFFLVGSFFNTLDAQGTPTIDTQGSSDIFLIHGDSSGFRWAKSIGGGGADVARSVAVGPGGDIVVVGEFKDAVDFGGGEISTDTLGSVFVARFSADGVHRSSMGFGATTSFSIGATSVAVDATGNTYFTGTFEKSIDLGNGPLTSEGRADIFMASYDSLGTHRWSKVIGGSSDEDSPRIATDTLGNVYLTGEFEGTTNVGGDNLDTQGFEDIFLASYKASDGTHRWSKGLGGGDTEQVRALSVSPEGQVSITGSYFSDNVDFEGATVSNQGLASMFLASFDAKGKGLWAKSFGATDTRTRAFGISTNTNGNLFVVGYLNAPLNFGGGMIPHGEQNDPYVASFGSDGSHRWSMSFTGPDDDIAWAVSAAGSGLAVAGTLRDTLTLGNQSFKSLDQDDGFIMQFRLEE